MVTARGGAGNAAGDAQGARLVPDCLHQLHLPLHHQAPDDGRRLARHALFHRPHPAVLHGRPFRIILASARQTRRRRPARVVCQPPGHLHCSDAVLRRGDGGPCRVLLPSTADAGVGTVRPRVGTGGRPRLQSGCS